MTKGNNLDQKVMKLLEEGKITPEGAKEMLMVNSQPGSSQDYSQPINQTENKRGFKIWPLVLLGLGVLGYFTYSNNPNIQNLMKGVKSYQPQNKINKTEQKTPEEIQFEENEILSSRLFSQVRAFDSRDNLNLQYGHLEDKFAIFSPDTYYLSPQGIYTRVCFDLNKSGRYWESIKLDLSKLKNPSETMNWSFWKIGNLLVAGNAEKIGFEGSTIFPKDNTQFVNLTKSESDIAYEKKLDQIQEELMNGKQIDSKYTTDSYGSRREWVNAGDLELMVRDYKLVKETRHYARTKCEDYKLYVDLTIRSVCTGRFALNLSEIYLDGIGKAEGTEKPKGVEYIPAMASVNQTYEFWVGRFGEEVVTITSPKFERCGESGYDSHGGKARINLEKLPKIKQGEIH